MTVSTLRQVLDAARWSPSGDNTQPWRFEILSERRVIVHGHDTRTHCVYDLDGRPSQMALGALLETLRIAASGHGMSTDVERLSDRPDTTPTFDVRLRSDDSVRPSPLIGAIARRSVQRRAMSTRPVSARDKSALEEAVGAGYRVRWFDGAAERWRMARLMFANARLRLTMHEAYLVHRDIIDWGQRYSVDKVPDRALGADAASLLLMRWAMQDWQRVRMLNRWFAGTWLPRLQMDLLPAMRCGAHFAIVSERAAADVDDHVEAGRRMQRAWLTATLLGLQHQPEVTPLVFARYVRDGVRFSTDPAAMAQGERLAAASDRLFGDELRRIVWLGRLGYGPPAASRSVRRPLDELSAPGSWPRGGSGDD